MLELHAQDPGDLVDLGAELAGQLVTTNSREVVSARVEESVLEVGTGGFCRQWLTWTSSLVDLEQRLFPGVDEVALLLPLTGEKVEVANEAVEVALVFESK